MVGEGLTNYLDTYNVIMLLFGCRVKLIRGKCMLYMKDNLLGILKEQMTDQGFSKAHLARCMNIAPQRVTEIMNGECSLERVMDALQSLGYDVCVGVGDSRIHDVPWNGQ